MRFGEVQELNEDALERASLINVMLARVISRPTLVIAEALFGKFTRRDEHAPTAPCNSYRANSHCQSDCPHFQLNQTTNHWIFTTTRLSGYTPSNELWSIDEENELDEDTKRKLVEAEGRRGQALPDAQTQRNGPLENQAKTLNINQIDTRPTIGYALMDTVEEGAAGLCELSESVLERPTLLVNNVAVSVKGGQDNDAKTMAEQIRTEIRNRFPNIFFDKDAPRRQADRFEHSIRLKENAKPFKISTRYAPFALKAELSRIVMELLARRIIRRSSS